MVSSREVDSLAFFQSLPKVELHRHLIGTIRIETLLDTAIKDGISLPTNDLYGLKNLIEVSEPVSNFRQFLTPLNILGLCFRDKKTTARVAYEAVEDVALASGFLVKKEKEHLNKHFKSISPNSKIH